jgi:hypothetical protein
MTPTELLAFVNERVLKSEDNVRRTWRKWQNALAASYAIGPPPSHRVIPYQRWVAVERQCDIARHAVGPRYK